VEPFTKRGSPNLLKEVVLRDTLSSALNKTPRVFSKTRRVDIPALKALFFEFGKIIHIYIHSRVADPTSVENLTEETFIAYWLAQNSKPTPIYQALTELFQIADHLIRTEIKNNPANTTSASPIHKLPPKYQSLLVLRYVMTLNIQQTAEVLGWRPRWVRLNERLALKWLSKVLSKANLHAAPASWLIQMRGQLAPDDNFLPYTSTRLIHIAKVTRLKALHKKYQESERQLSFFSLIRSPKFVKHAVTTLVVIAMALSSSVQLVSAAQSSLPGESFYSAKLLIEGAELLTNYEQAVPLHAKFASRRIEELDLLTFYGKNFGIPIALENLTWHLQTIETILSEEDYQISAADLAAKDQLEEKIQAHVDIFIRLQSSLGGEHLAMVNNVVEFSQYAPAFVDNQNLNPAQPPTTFSNTDGAPLPGLSENGDTPPTFSQSTVENVPSSNAQSQDEDFDLPILDEDDDKGPKDGKAKGKDQGKGKGKGVGKGNGNGEDQDEDVEEQEVEDEEQEDDDDDDD
jgi:DNA-directed RNA polymerase specialized sigma24 family protein